MRSSMVLLLVLVGCDALPREPEPPAPPPDPPADALEAALRERGAVVADWMTRDGEPMRGTIDEGEARDFSHVMVPGFCYKVVAVSGEGIEDLELRLYDGNSVLLQRDTTQDPQPFLGRERPVCPPETATYRLEVRAVAGGGDFAVHFYRSLYRLPSAYQSARPPKPNSRARARALRAGSTGKGAFSALRAGPGCRRCPRRGRRSPADSARGSRGA